MLHQGYVYVKKKDLTDGWVLFECERRRNQKGCPGRVQINGDQIVVVKEHTHASNPARNEAMKVVTAQTTVEASQQIIENSIAGIQDAVAVELPSCK